MSTRLKSLFLFSLLYGVLALPLAAQELQYLVEVFFFRDPEGKPFAEVQLNFDGSSMVWKRQASGRYKATAEAMLFVSSAGRDSGSAKALKVELSSPEIADTAGSNKSVRLIDFRRIQLPPGTYTLTGTVDDVNNSQPGKYGFERDFVIRGPEDPLYPFSDFMFVQSVTKTQDKKPWTRYGNDVLPRIDGDYFGKEDSLTFYIELYETGNIAPGGSFFVHAYVTPAQSSEKLEGLQVTMKRSARKLDAFWFTFPIRDLSTQTYFLQMEVLSGGKKIAWVARKFYVFNPGIQYVQPDVSPSDFDRTFAFDPTLIDEHIGPMMYVATKTEKDFASSLVTTDQKKSYFYSFWDKRRRTGQLSAMQPFMEFKSKLDYANDHYRTNSVKGWNTDRGRVLIQYGPPNDIEYFQLEKWRFPHEIWHYNTIGSQNNLIFVFYDPDLVTNNLELLHSNVIGEPNNSRWKLELVRRSVQNGNLDADDPSQDMQRQQSNDPRYYKN